MTVGSFTLVDAGLLASQNGGIVPGTDAMYAVLILNAHGAPAVATEATLADISADETVDADYDQVVAVLTVTETAGVIKIDMAQVDFGAAVTISARFFYLLKGAAAAPISTDPILGFMDLNDGGAADVSSINSDFKVDANAANGLYQVTEAP